MPPPDPAPPSLLGSFRALGDSLLASVQDRIDLISLELQEEKLRLIQSFVWISAAVFSGMMALTFASLAVVYAFWESAPLAVMVGLAILYTAGAIVTLVSFRRHLARQPRPFGATLEELAKDRACIPDEN